MTSRTVKYTWDEVNRMKSMQAPGSGATYAYRADGMRVRKIEGISLGVNLNEEEEVSGYYDMLSVNRPTTRYYYDGQMPLGEDRTYKDPANPAHGHDFMDQVWYGLGARGVDYQNGRTLDKTTSTWGSLKEVYPVYDTHGNGVAVFEWSSDDGYDIDNSERTFDAWGAVRSTAGDPPQQGYCATLGHRSDNESGLTYMRARYYEPGTGRFISADPYRSDANGYIYCGSDPINRSDFSGNSWRDTEKSLRNTLMLAALLYLVLNCVTAVSSLDIENAYGLCVKAFDFSILGALGAPEAIVDAVGLGGKLVDMLIEAVKGAVSGAVSGGIKGFIFGGPEGAITGAMGGAVKGFISGLIKGTGLVEDYSYLFVCHGLRLSWYIDDIDRF